MNQLGIRKDNKMPCGLCGQDGHNRRTCMSHHPRLDHPEITIQDWQILWKDTTWIGGDYRAYLIRENSENYQHPMTVDEKIHYFTLLRGEEGEAIRYIAGIHTRNQPAPPQDQDQDMPPPHPDSVEANRRTQSDTQTEDQLLPSTDRDAIIAARMQAREYRVIVTAITNRPQMQAFRNYDNRTGKTVYVYWAERHTFLPKHTISVDLLNRTTRSNFRLGPRTKLYFSCEMLDPFTSINEMPNKRHVFQESIYESPTQRITIKLPENQRTKWKNAAIKMNYLMEQLKRMGIENDKLYPNLASIADMHQDIEMPVASEVDKHRAGVPSAFDT